MTPAQISSLKMYFETILPFCDTQKVKSLLVRLGYQVDEITPALCAKAYMENGKDFFRPFGKIALNAIDSPKFEAYKKALLDNAGQRVKINKASDGSMTQADKVNAGIQYLNVFSSWLDKGVDAYRLSKDSTSAKEALAEAERLKALSGYEELQAKNTKQWLWPVIGAVAVLMVVIIAVVILSGRKK